MGIEEKSFVNWPIWLYISLSLWSISCTWQVCTFRLVVKNAASLLGDKDPVKLEAESMLNDLIR